MNSRAVTFGRRLGGTVGGIAAPRKVRAWTYSAQRTQQLVRDDIDRSSTRWRSPWESPMNEQNRWKAPSLVGHCVHIRQIPRGIKSHSGGAFPRYYVSISGAVPCCQ
jgi:hypothetical protein